MSSDCSQKYLEKNLIEYYSMSSEEYITHRDRIENEEKNNSILVTGKEQVKFFLKTQGLALDEECIEEILSFLRFEYILHLDFDFSKIKLRIYKTKDPKVEKTIEAFKI